MTGEENLGNEQEGQEQFVDESYITDLQHKLKTAENKSLDLASGYSASGIGQNDPNVIIYQLDSAKLIEDLKHFYKGDEIGYDDQLNEVWLPATNSESITLNSFGVNSLLEIITKYINPNTKLSFYSEGRIYEILGDLGEEMIMFIECNMKKIGMDTYFKKTKFRLIVVTTLHTIESTYRSALQGKMFEEINKARIEVNTGQPGFNNYGGYPSVSQMPQKKGSFRWPWQ